MRKIYHTNAKKAIVAVLISDQTNCKLWRVIRIKILDDKIQSLEDTDP